VGAQNVKNGKAFEFCVASAASQFLGIEVERGNGVDLAARYLADLPAAKQRLFQSASRRAVEHVFGQLEGDSLSKRVPRFVRMSPDSAGRVGDVRDIVVVCDDGEIGISCKTNHDAFKHSRLSRRIDFVKQWGLSSSGCSDNYWNKVTPVFDQLSIIREASRGQATWSDIKDVGATVYKPMLDAFQTELQRVCGAGDQSSEESVRNLASYILGKTDFYKVIVRSRERRVDIQGFNSQGSLSISRMKLPDRVVSIDATSGGLMSRVVFLTRGYTFSFRIHSAKKQVEPSLKFDIKAVSLPPTEIYVNHLRVEV